MRKINGVAAVFVTILAMGMTANAGQTPMNNLKLRVVTDRKTYAANAPIKMTFTIKNTSAMPITLTYSDGKRYDFEISTGRNTGGKAENTLWHWSKNLSFTQDIGTETLGAGKILTYTETYKPGTPTIPTLKPGIYTLTAYPTPLDKALPRATTTFKIVAAK